MIALDIGVIILENLKMKFIGEFPFEWFLKSDDSIATNQTFPRVIKLSGVDITANNLLNQISSILENTYLYLDAVKFETTIFSFLFEISKSNIIINNSELIADYDLKGISNYFINLTSSLISIQGTKIFGRSATQSSIDKVFLVLWVSNELSVFNLVTRNLSLILVSN